MLSLLLLLACKDEPPVDSTPAVDSTPPIDSEVIDRELAAGIYVLDSLDWGEETADLAALDTIIGDARVTALGESVHFSGGYHQARARMIPYLIEELGFRAVAFEGPWLSAEGSRPFVESCEGSLTDAMVGLYFSVWQSVDQARVMQWLCDWNDAHPDDPVAFWGFDIQEPWRDGPWLRALLSEVDEAGTEHLRAGVSDCFGAGYDSVTAVYDDPLAYGVLTGTETWPAERSERCVEVLPEVDAWLADNAHIVAAGEDITGSVYPAGWVDMGSHLATQLGEDYAPIGFIASEVTWNWPGQPVNDSRAARASAEAALEGVEGELLLVDLAAASADGSFLDETTSMPLGHPGTGRMVPKDHYRGLFYMRSSPEMEFWGARGPQPAMSRESWLLPTTPFGRR